MKTPRHFLKIIFAAIAFCALAPSPLFACAACYGKSSSPLAHGMNWGIFTLMSVIVTVLVSIASFFVYIIRREALHAVKNSIPQNPVKV